MATTAPFVWHRGRQREVFRGVIDVATMPITVSLHAAAYVPNVNDHLLLADATNELAVGTYARKTLTNVKLGAAVAGKKRLTYDAVSWAGLNTLGTQVTNAVFSLADGRVLGHQPIVDEASGATNLAPSGGGLVLRAYDPDSEPPGGGGTVSYAAGSAAEALGWGYPPPSTPSKTATRAAYTGHTYTRTVHVFCHLGLKTARAGWPATVRDAMGLNPSVTPPTQGRTECLYMTLPVMEKADAKIGETQASIRQTFDLILAGENDDYYEAVAGYLNAGNADAHFSNGLPKYAGQLSQEWNLTSFPYFIGQDPVKAGKVWNYMAGKIAAAGVDISTAGFPLFVNVNTVGGASWEDVLTFFDQCTLASGLSVDSYLNDWSGLYWNARGVTATTGITSGKGTERDHTAAVQAARLGNKNPALETQPRVSAWKVVRECQRRGLLFGIDEWGTVTTTIPPADKYNWGSGDDPAGIEAYWQFLEDVAPLGILFQANYFDYNVQDTGLNHAINEHPNAKARLVSKFAAV